MLKDKQVPVLPDVGDYVTIGQTFKVKGKEEHNGRIMMTMYTNSDVGFVERVIVPIEWCDLITKKELETSG